MVIYLLDTCVLIELFRGNPNTCTWLSSVPASQLKISSVTVMELQAGIEYTTVKVEEKKEQLKRVLSVFEEISFEHQDAIETAKIRAVLKRAGQMIGPYDLQLAGSALARGFTFVTGNLKEFTRVEGLEIFEIPSTASEAGGLG